MRTLSISGGPAVSSLAFVSCSAVAGRSSTSRYRFAMEDHYAAWRRFHCSNSKFSWRASVEIDGQRCVWCFYGIDNITQVSLFSKDLSTEALENGPQSGVGQNDDNLKVCT